MNNNWKNIIPRDVYRRLCECRNTWEDVKIIARAIKECNPQYSSEDCVAETLDWMDSNNQYFDLSRRQYNELIAYVGTAMSPDYLDDLVDEAIDIYCESLDMEEVQDLLFREVGIERGLDLLNRVKKAIDEGNY